MRKRLAWSGLLAAVLVIGAATGVTAQTCSKADFADAIDRAGAAMRKANSDNAPRLQALMRLLKEQKGWAEAEYQEKAIELAHDQRLEELDRKANELLARLDRLGGDVPEKSPSCSALTELDATGIELVATMKARASHLASRLEVLAKGQQPPPARAAAPEAPPAQPKAAAPAKAPPAAPSTSPPAKEPAKEIAAAPLPQAAAPPTPPPPRVPAGPGREQVTAQTLPPPSPAVPSPPPAPPWQTTTDPASVGPRTAPGQPYTPPPPISIEAAEGYTIDEIRAASQGFFGTLSGGLASVIEHAFSKLGRPTAYILGAEGGGAFLAGLRYGSGSLYVRAGSSTPVYWHGPSIGYDFGAAGSKTMFLIYKLTDAEALFSTFTGIDGSAYLVGGVGMTVLTNGSVNMAPIRTGLGLRVGASIGYLRFTRRPTWNPF